MRNSPKQREGGKVDKKGTHLTYVLGDQPVAGRLPLAQPTRWYTVVRRQGAVHGGGGAGGRGQLLRPRTTDQDRPQLRAPSPEPLRHHAGHLP